MRGIRGLRRWRIGLPVLAVVIVVLAGGIAMATSTVPGHPVPGMTAPDWSQLSVGPYPSAPTDYKPLYSGASDVYEIESRRMLGYLVSPDEIDPDVTYLGGARTVDDSDGNFGDEVGLLAAPFPKNWQPVAQRNRLIAGAYIWRNNNSVRARKHITLAIMRFPSEQAAKAAADGFADALAAPGLHALPTDGLEARASSISDDKGQIFAAHGVYAIVGHAVMPQADATALAERLQAMLRAQLAKMADLKPTPLEDIPDLPTDPDGIMRMTLPNKYDSSDSDLFGFRQGGVYSAAGALHFERDGAAARKAFAAAGVDLVARNGATVYRTRDLAAAFGLQAALTTPGRDDDEFPNPPGLTDAHCIQLDEPEPVRRATYLCAVVYGRYVAVIGAQAEFSGAEPGSFPQRVAAQYSMLAKSG
ncbi:DUF7373 family lipoprotein [Nocardia sp. CDC160]|uniref:DUF7373 family lipoprotein n=1 Tax=Nocardia sp. CDC160 TaxID=3112166 RepID=UPI002DC04476|nr:hypothetical protein [Nocardia sp. CDC160]MEC3915080.1 hypothetical protein [Nocardia sp. CDC160]